MTGHVYLVHPPFQPSTLNPPNPNPNPKRLPSSNPTVSFMRCQSSHSVQRLASSSWQIRLISSFSILHPKYVDGRLTSSFVTRFLLNLDLSNINHRTSPIQ